MKTTLDILEDVTGWSGPAGATFTVNDHPQYIADNLDHSLVIYIPAGSSGQDFAKALTPVALGACAEIVLSVWSRNLRSVGTSQPTGFSYKISFDGAHEFMLPTGEGFDSASFGINGWSSADQITITPTTDGEDWLIISGCYAIEDDYPLDVMVGVKAGIEKAVASLLPNGVAIGTVTCSANAPFLIPSSTLYIEKGAVLYVEDGATSETHQVERFDGDQIRFTSLYDGAAMKYAHSIRPLSLLVPVEYGVQEQEARIPCITIWGMAQANAQSRQDTFTVEDSIDPTGSGAVRRTPWIQNFKILIDCEARQHQLLAMISRCARRFLASSRVWINGRANELPYPGDAVYIEPKESVVMIPKLQYEINIEVHEERESRTWMNKVTGETLTYTYKSGIL